jgi:hypothetical protein
MSLTEASRLAELRRDPDKPHPVEALEGMLRSGRATAEVRRAERAAREAQLREVLLRHRADRAPKEPGAEPREEDDPLEAALLEVHDRRHRETLRAALAEPSNLDLWPSTFQFDAEVVAIALVNRAGFSRLDKASELTIARMKPDALGHPTLHQMSPRGLRDLLMPYVVLDVAGKPRSLADVWLRSVGAVRHEGIVLEADPARAPPRALNLWTGLEVQPRPGAADTSRIHELLLALAGGDEAAKDYLLRWCAWAVQHPTTRSETAVALRGPEGCGKTTLGEALLAPCFGSHARHLTREEDLVGRFNARLAGACFVLADEVFVTAPAASERLRTLVTSAAIEVEAKGRDPIPVPNAVKILLTTNREQALNLGSGARRYVVCECREFHSSRTPEDRAWWRSFYADLETGMRAAWLAELLALDLTGWDIRAVPTTRATEDDRVASQSPEVRWLQEALTDPPAGGSLLDEAVTVRGEDVVVDPRLALDDIRQDLGRGSRVTRKALVRLLEDSGARLRRVGVGGRRPRVLVWASLGEARAGLARRAGVSVEALFTEREEA